MRRPRRSWRGIKRARHHCGDRQPEADRAHRDGGGILGSSHTPGGHQRRGRHALPLHPSGEPFQIPFSETKIGHGVFFEKNPMTNKIKKFLYILEHLIPDGRDEIPTFALKPTLATVGYHIK